jgi:hypothetical protein
MISARIALFSVIAATVLASGCSSSTGPRPLTPEEKLAIFKEDQERHFEQQAMLRQREAEDLLRQKRYDDLFIRVCARTDI